MTAAAAKSMVRGACPGALRPMESGDGLIVRVRPRGGALSVAAVAALARAAAKFGNGHVDLTRRANLQIRGVTVASLPGLQAALDDLGLLDATPEAEAVRNVMVSPLAGIDPGEVIDVRPIALALERHIASEPGLWRLPPKFGFVVDGGGALGLAGERADIRIGAVSRDAVAIGIDRSDGPMWLGLATPASAARAACRVASAFLEKQPAGSRMRMREADADAVSRIRSALAPLIQPVDGIPEPSSRRRSGPTQVSASDRPGVVDPGLRRDDVGSGASALRFSEGPRIGELRHGSEVFAVGVAAPFGRVEADMLLGLADAAGEQGVTEIRVSPWRALYLPVSGEEKCAALLGTARKLGFVTDPDDAVFRIEACPGAPACRSASLDTRAAAHAMSRLLPVLDGAWRVHVSGCAKGCACSAPADLVLVGGQGRFGIVRNGRADGTPERFIAPDELDRLPEVLARGGGGARP